MKAWLLRICEQARFDPMGIEVQMGIDKVDGELFNAVREQRRLRLQARYFAWQVECICLAHLLFTGTWPHSGG